VAPVVTFNEGPCRIAEQRKKSSKVYLEGSLHARKWQEKMSPKER